MPPPRPASNPAATVDLLCVGVVVGAHGITGQLRIKSFTADPAALTRYGPLRTETGQAWRLSQVAVGAKGVLTVRVDRIGDRSEAEAVKGVKLYVARAMLPAPQEEEFYVADLIGLAAETVAGEPLGHVRAVYDFGAGDVIAVQGGTEELLLPFTRRVVPLVDVAGGRVVIDPPLPSGGDEEERDGP